MSPGNSPAEVRDDLALSSTRLLSDVGGKFLFVVHLVWNRR